jgi:aspartate carbamoyltransferase catalytic subunit
MASITDVVSMKPFSRKEIDAILDLALTFEKVARGDQESHLLSGKVLATLFYEPSTRTRLSFEAAMVRLGGKVLSVADMRRSSSAWKGESLADTIRTVENYADAIVLRHPEAGAAATAAQCASVPVLNAGLTITLVGDHKHCRATNSLAFGLANYNVNLILVNPPSLDVSRNVLNYVKERNLSVEETNDLEDAIQRSNVVYIFRIQKERFADPEEYERLKGAYRLDRALLEKTGRDLTIMHPLPRVDELPEEVDALPGASYFRQTFNGVLVRMALLSLVLGKAQL